MLSLQTASQTQTMKFQEARINDLLKQADDLATLERSMQEQYGLLLQMNEFTHAMIGDVRSAGRRQRTMRDSFADFDDWFRPIRNYFYWEPHCYDIPICYSLRAIFDRLDGVDLISENLKAPRGEPRSNRCDHAPAVRPSSRR